VGDSEKPSGKYPVGLSGEGKRWGTGGEKPSAAVSFPSDLASKEVEKGRYFLCSFKNITIFPIS
jgi:hypothetical protein